MCIRCGGQEALPDRPYCIHCIFAVRAEVEVGLRQLSDYLQLWAEFDQWCKSHGVWA